MQLAAPPVLPAFHRQVPVQDHAPFLDRDL